MVAIALPRMGFDEPEPGLELEEEDLDMANDG